MQRKLRAGSWTVELDDRGVLRDLRLGDEEVLRALAGVVRDADWGTVDGEVTFEGLQVEEDAFTVVFWSVHHSDAVDFRWRGTVVGTADSTIRFVFEGEAVAASCSNRIGMVALHSLNWAGRSVQVVHTDGRIENCSYPDLIAPHQPFLDVAAFRQASAGGAEIEIAFDGDLFETEDQRNWSDASFKTYSRPLSLPFPVDFGAGDTVRQSVTLRATGALPSRETADLGQVSLTVGTTRSPWPRIGLGLSSVGDAFADAATVALRPAWLRTDLLLDADGTLHGTEALEHVRTMGLPVELALTIAEPPPSTAAQLVEVLDRQDVDHILVYTQNAETTSDSSCAFVRALTDGASDAAPPMVAGTDGNLAELNRFPLEVDGIDGIVFSINAQVHDTADQAVMQTTEAYEAIVATARAHGRARGATDSGSVTVSPVTLKPRRNLYATGEKTSLSTDMIAPESIDQRQTEQFTAAWTVAVLTQLARARVDWVTLFEHAGPRGVMSADGVPYPVHDVLAAALTAEYAVPLTGDTSTVTGFVVCAGSRRTAVLANVTAQERTVHLHGFSDGAVKHVMAPYDTLILTNGEA